MESLGISWFWGEFLGRIAKDKTAVETASTQTKFASAEETAVETAQSEDSTRRRVGFVRLDAVSTAHSSIKSL